MVLHCRQVGVLVQEMGVAQEIVSLCRARESGTETKKSWWSREQVALAVIQSTLFNTILVCDHSLPRVQ